MTLEQYILNPMGKNNAVLNGATRELMRKQYMHKFDNLMLRENGKMDYYCYKDAKKNEYWILIKVPSETVEGFYYENVFKFYNGPETANEKDLFKWNVQFYANDPAFVYTYAHVFAERAIFIPELRRKMSKEALREVPDEKNPEQLVGYVKTIYFAYLLMQNRRLNIVSKFDAESQPLRANILLDQITEADEKIRSRQEEGKGISKARKKNLNADLVRNIKKAGGKDLDFGKKYNVKTSKHIKTIKSSNTVKTTGKSKVVKKK